MALCPASGGFRGDVEASAPCSLLRLSSVNHISKVCSDVEASVVFYRDVLGFIMVKRPDSFNDSFDGCWLWRYGLGLHLIKGQPVPRSSHIDPKSDHLSFQADSLDEVEAALASRGIPFVRQQVVEGGLQVRQLFFHDPDNNMIEVCNCDCLPVIPLDTAVCEACGIGQPLHPHHPHHVCDQEDEATSAGSRDSLDSGRSEQFPSVAHTLAAVPLPAGTGGM